jgi:hypothetical protein
MASIVDCVSYPICANVVCDIQAVFVSQDIEADASIYYKQAMKEAAEEVYY